MGRQTDKQTDEHIFSLIIQGDPVKDLMHRFIGEEGAEKRKTLTVDSVPLDECGLRELLVR